MTSKKLTTAVRRGAKSPQQTSAHRSAGRPPKVRPMAKATRSVAKPATKVSAKPIIKKTVAKPATKRQPVNKPVSKKRLAAQPKVVVVTNQPLIDEDEFTVWQSVRKEPTADRTDDNPVEEPIGQVSFQEQPETESVAVEWPDESELASQAEEQRFGRLYRRLALCFIGLIAVVVMAMFYYSLLRVKIVLFPVDSQQAQNKTILLTDATPVAAGTLPAKFIQASTEYRQTFKATGQEQTAEGGRLTGQVTLINETGQDQPLKATTRLVTADGVMYRLRSFVTVPAGGKISAEAYADQLKPENAIPAQTRFTIPGLWAGLQEKIYAVADQQIDYQINSQPIVLTTDIEQAIAQAKQTAAEQVKNKLNQLAGDEGSIKSGAETVAYWIDDSNWSAITDVQAGDKKAEFTITVKATAGAALISSEAVKEIVSADDSSLAFKIDDQSLTYQLVDWQPEQHQAALKATYSTKLSSSQADQLIDKSALVGLNRQQLATYLSGQSNLITYQVTWQPSFLKKVPGTDKIQLQIGK